LTYSIVARDKETGELGVAVQSHWFSVGSVVSWARAGVGAVATQAMAELSYGPLGLELMSSGKTAEEALEALLSSDPKFDTRQVAFIDSKGNAAVHTGKKCIPHAGHIKGDQFTCQANLMRNDTIWDAMARDFKKNSNEEGKKRRNERLPFAERLISALEAAEAAGGDVRGKQSAAILVVSPNLAPNAWSGKLIDLRVEDSQAPLPELKRLLRLHRAYEWANRGDELISAGKVEESLQAYEKAGRFAPDLEELEFWQAVSLVQSRRLKDAKPIFKRVFRKNKDWIQVTKTLPKIGLLPKNRTIIREILS
jgi:uncharacterized Ntn-hydrolase superfamily protein